MSILLNTTLPRLRGGGGGGGGGGGHFAIFEIFALISSNCDHSGLECFKKYSSPILIIRPCLPLRTYKFQGEDYENKTDDTK